MSLAVTGSETHSSTSVPDADCLCSLDTAALSPGELAYVQDTKQFYFFDPDSVATADGVEVVCAVNDCGRWIRACINCEGPTGTTGSSACDETCTFARPSSSTMLLADLASLNTDGFVDGEWAFVESLSSYFTLALNWTGPAADGITILDAFGTPGAVWLRDVSIANARWTYQRIYHVNEATGNDEYDGTSATVGGNLVGPLRTVDEFTRRLRLYSIPETGTDPAYELHVHSNITVGAFRFSPLPANDGLTSFALLVPLVLIVGDETPLALPTGAGTFTNIAPTDPNSGAGGTQLTVTDLSMTWAGFTLQKVVLGPTSSSPGAVAFVLQDLGGGSAILSDFYDTSGANITPLVGDTYSIVSLFQWTIDRGSVALAADIGTVVYQNLEIVPSVTPSEQTAEITYFGCVFREVGWGYLAIFPESGDNAFFSNCLFDGGVDTSEFIHDNRSFQFIQQCAFYNVHINCISLGAATYLDTIFWQSYISMGHSPQPGRPGTDRGITLGSSEGPGNSVWHVDVAFPGKNGVENGKGSRLTVANKLFGNVGSGFGYQSVNGAEMFYGYGAASVVLKITGTAGDFTFEQQTASIPKLTPGAVVPLASPLVTWAQLQAAPFLGSVIDLIGNDAGTQGAKCGRMVHFVP